MSNRPTIRDHVLRAFALGRVDELNAVAPEGLEVKTIEDAERLAAWATTEGRSARELGLNPRALRMNPRHFVTR